MCWYENGMENCWKEGKADGPEPLLPAGGCGWISVYTRVHLSVPMCVCVYYMGQRGYSLCNGPDGT